MVEDVCYPLLFGPGVLGPGGRAISSKPHSSEVKAGRRNDEFPITGLTLFAGGPGPTERGVLRLSSDAIDMFFRLLVKSL